MHSLQLGQGGTAGLAGYNFASSVGSDNLSGLAFRESVALAGLSGLGFDWGAFTNTVATATQPLVQAFSRRIQSTPGTTIRTATGEMISTQSAGYPVVSGGIATSTDLGGSTLIVAGVAALALVLIMRGRR